VARRGVELGACGRCRQVRGGHDRKRRIGGPAHRGVEPAGGDAHAALGIDELQAGVGDLRLQPQHVRLGNSPRVAAGKRKPLMRLGASDVLCGDRLEVPGGGQRIEGGVHGQPHVGLQGGGVGFRTGAARNGGLEPRTSFAEIEERHARGDASVPVVKRSDQLGNRPAGERQP
jgi:hypothetical protein